MGELIEHAVETILSSDGDATIGPMNGAALASSGLHVSGDETLTKKITDWAAAHGMQVTL